MQDTYDGLDRLKEAKRGLRTTANGTAATEVSFVQGARMYMIFFGIVVVICMQGCTRPSMDLVNTLVYNGTSLQPFQVEAVDTVFDVKRSNRVLVVFFYTGWRNMRFVDYWLEENVLKVQVIDWDGMGGSAPATTTQVLASADADVVTVYRMLRDVVGRATHDVARGVTSDAPGFHWIIDVDHRRAIAVSERGDMGPILRGDGTITDAGVVKPSLAKTVDNELMVIERWMSVRTTASASAAPPR